MSGRYLTDLADVCRRAGLVVQEEPGWQSRSRSSGGYASGRPTTVMCHHTASGASSDGQADVNYCCYGSADRPLANLYLARSGKVWVMAAGATNTNGKGGPLNGVPADSMNTYAVAIEAANNGVGEPWPAAQQDAYVVLVVALQDAYGCPHVSSHFEWSPGRKI
ncbi:MAG TPA: N-acetylmuramoyl-L-alanine amidase, partial [Acidimicrobiales bacterium]